MTVGTGTPEVTDYAINAAGQLTGEGTKSYVYDAWGELSEVKDGATVRQSLAWNADGTLARATLYDSGGTFVKTVAMAYDERGQRVGRKELDSGGAATGPGKRWLRNWQNFTVHSDEIEELDGAGGVQADYMYGDGERGSRLLAATRAGAGAGGAAATAGVHADHLGSVGGLTGADGLGIAGGDVDYDPFGATLAAGASALDRRYTGQPLDADLGLQYHRYRWLNAGNGRFASPDPIFDFPNNFGLRYGYGGYSPAMKEDVSGLFSLTELEVTAYIQGLVTQVVVPKFTSFIVQTVMTAAGIDPMMLLGPIFETLAESFDLAKYMDEAFDWLKNGWDTLGGDQIVAAVQSLSKIFTILQTITSGLSAVMGIVKFFLNKTISNAWDAVGKIMDFINAINSEHDFQIELNPVLMGRIVSKLRGLEWHHIIPNTGTAGRKGELTEKFKGWFKDAPGLFINTREVNVRQFKQFGNGTHSIRYYELVERLGDKALDDISPDTDEYSTALRTLINDLAALIEKHPYILDRHWNGEFNP